MTDDDTKDRTPEEILMEALKKECGIDYIGTYTGEYVPNPKKARKNKGFEGKIDIMGRWRV